MAERPEVVAVAKRWGPDALALVFVAVATWLCWSRFSTAGSEIPGRTPFRLTSDYFNYYIPMTEAAGARLRSGALPLWNPEACSGMPLLATLQTSVLYPGTWLAAIFPAHLLLPWLGISQCLLGGLFAFALFRAWGCERAASSAGGLLFVFSCCLGQTLWPPAIATICWVPWLLLAVHQLARGAGAGWWMGLAVGAALQALAGFPQYLLYGYAVVLPYAALVLAHGHRSREPDGRRAIRRLLAIGSALAVGFGLAGVQLLPSAELLQQSARAEALTPAQVHYLHPIQRFVSSGRTLANALDGSPGGISFGEPGSGYLGTATLFFIAAAGVARRREPLVWLLLALGAVSLPLSDGHLGRWPGLYSAFAEIPVVGSLRTPERLRLVTCVCATGLAALGLAALQASGERRSLQRQATVVLGTTGLVLSLAAGVGMTGAPLYRSLLVLGLSLGLCLTLVWSSTRLRRSVSCALLLAFLALDLSLATSTRATLRDIPDAWVGVYRHGPSTTLAANELEVLRRRAGSGRLVLDSLLPFTGGGATGGVRRVSCYEPLAPAQWTRLAEKLGTRREGGVTLSKLRGPPGSLVEDLTSVRGRVVFSDGAFRLEENPDALPRAYFLAVTRTASREAALDALARGVLRPRSETLVEADLGLDAPARATAGPIPASVLEGEPERVVAEVDAPTAGLLILTDTDYPGWQATVDGAPALIVRANGLHRAVVVDPGRHQVVFSYRPESLRYGALLSAVSALALLGVAAASFRRSRLRALGVAALLGLGCTPQAPSSPDILLLTLDTTRFDALGVYGSPPARTPSLDRLAGTSRQFTRAETTAPYTGPAHASMLTGLLPPRHGLRDFLGDALPEEVTTIAETLSDAGYVTAAFVSAYVLDARYGLDQGFDVYRGAPPRKQGRGFAERPAVDTVDELLAWYAKRDPSRPIFVWLHLFDAHYPYRPPSEFRMQVPWLDPPARRRLRYHEEVTYMDSQIGRVLERLDDGKLVILVVADHGEPLGERGIPVGAHSPNLLEATLHVPLFVRAPGLPAGVDDRQVSVTDVFPTLLDLAGLPVPPEIDGRSLLAPAPGGPRPAYSETLYEHFPKRAAAGSELVSLRLDGWRLVSAPGRLELYDLAHDPEELHDLSTEQPAEVSRLQSALETLRAGWVGSAASRPLVPDDEEDHLERLRSLGYVE